MGGIAALNLPHNKQFGLDNALTISSSLSGTYVYIHTCMYVYMYSVHTYKYNLLQLIKKEPGIILSSPFTM